MDEKDQVVFCRLCLRTDLTRKYILSDDEQRKFILSFFKTHGFPQVLDESSYACFECRSLLHRSYSFVRKTMRAQKALYMLQKQQEQLTNTSLQSLDRGKYKIESNLACCKPKTIIVLHHGTVFKQNPETITPLVKKPEGNITLKTESSELQDDNLDQIESMVFQEFSNCAFMCKDNKNNDLDTEQLKYEVTDGLCNIKNIKKDSFFNVDVKIEPDICIFNDDVDNIEDNSEYVDPLADLALNERNDSVITITSSDDSYTVEKIKKRKLKQKNKKKKTKKSIPKSKVSLDLFSSDDERKAKIKKKRQKVVWPEMPIFEERFRTRKDVNYKALHGFDDDEEAKKEKGKKRMKEADDDDDFVPTGVDSSDESADNSYDSYDDKGKVIRYKKDTREFPMKCELCEGIITSKKEHFYHYLQMHSAVQYPYRIEKTELCRYCGKAVNKIKLAAHENKHGGQKFECDICLKKYSTKDAMLEHKKRVHEKQARCVCDYCDRGFFMKTDLMRHIRTHTGEKPFKCHLCNYRVAHKGNIKVHVRQFHQHMAPNTEGKSTNSVKKRKNNKNKSEESENSIENGSRKKGRRKITSGDNKRRRKRRKVVTDSDTE